MKNLTLVIPAKYEADSLPKVLEEIRTFGCKIIIVLEPKDIETIESIKGYNCKIVYQSDKGYGNALIEGIENVSSEYLCIFNADGSFDPKYLFPMLKKCEDGLDFVFASRYMENSGSDDDTLMTKIGNYIFTKIGNIFFSVYISDILFTFLLGKTDSFKKLKLKSKDFSLCVEMPIKAKRYDMKYIDIPSYERKRIAGKKKVSPFIDGFRILLGMISLFLKR